LEPNREIETVNLDFQEDVTGEWEYVMIKKHEPDEDGEGEDGSTSDKDKKEADEEEVLDMPPSWSP
jgi:hypothetical protein